VLNADTATFIAQRFTAGARLWAFIFWGEKTTLNYSTAFIAGT